MPAISSLCKFLFSVIIAMALNGIFASRLWGDLAQQEAANYEAKLNLAIRRNPNNRANARTGHPDVFASAAEFERHPFSAEFFNVHFVSNASDSPIFQRYALRFAAESGKSDAESSVRLLDTSITKGSGPVDDEIDCAIYAFEAGAILSPLTFADLVSVFGKTHPNSLGTVLMRAQIPTALLSEVLPRLSIETRTQCARGLSNRVINGTSDEIKAALRLFSNPSEIPVECSTKFVLAASLIDPDAVDKWLQQADPKTKGRILNEIYRSFVQDARRPINQKILGWNVRAQCLLSTKSLFAEADSQTIILLISSCTGPGSMEVLANVAERYRDSKETGGDSPRRSAFWYMNYIQIENGGFSSAIQNIENGVNRKDSDLTNASISTLVGADRAKAKAYLLETTDLNVRREIEDQLLRQVDPREPNEERQRLLNATLDAIKSENEISDALKTRIKYLVEHEAEYDRPTAIRLIDKIPDGATKEKTFGDFVKHWAKNDPVSASDWIATLPPSRSRDAAVSELVQASHDDPEVAFQNAAAIANVDIRRKAAISLIERWKPLNPGAIATLLDASSMTVEDKAFLAEKLADKEQKGGKK